MTTFGWDASHYDDPAGVRDGIDFYTHKLTDGDHFYLDPEYRAAMDAARAVGIPVLGAYHVLHGQRSLRNQAQWMVERADALTPWWRTWPYWIWQMDCEPFGYNIRPGVAECNAFGRELMAASGRPLRAVEGYLPAWSYGSGVTLLEFPWWQSSYVAGSGPYRSLYPGDTSSRWTAVGRRADFLQYSSSAVIAGQTTCDANAFVGTLDNLKAFIGGGAPAPARETDMPVFVRCVENGGLYAFPVAKWYRSQKAFDDARFVYGAGTPLPVATVETLDQVRDAFGFIPGVDVPADEHGNVLVATGGSGGDGVTPAEAAAIADVRIAAAHVVPGASA